MGKGEMPLKINDKHPPGQAIACGSCFLRGIVIRGIPGRLEEDLSDDIGVPFWSCFPDARKSSGEHLHLWGDPLMEFRIKVLQKSLDLWRKKRA